MLNSAADRRLQLTNASPSTATYVSRSSRSTNQTGPYKKEAPAVGEREPGETLRHETPVSFHLNDSSADSTLAMSGQLSGSNTLTVSETASADPLRHTLLQRDHHHDCFAMSVTAREPPSSDGRWAK
eukprot:TRINITY_DN22050_c0_g1_i2.p2 TRINITY_DN22050_c0_g1~~TRINITY_DN22050_c0_g1_i2.p2  ORF type:complete len:127 (-),score=26.59 TRINITY_DN22050_c0_g1_i2:291-671(-)